MAKDKSSDATKKRKLEETELEIDVNAPEPPSKKALRKAKKQQALGPAVTTPATEESDLKRLSGLEGERSKYGIWIGNLAFITAKKDLYKFLITNSDVPIPAEQITRIHMPSGTDGRSQNRGFAYVDLATQDLVDTALQLSETLLGGRRLLIKDAKNFQGRPENTKPKPEVPSRPPNRKIFVGNLAFETTTEEVEKHFEVCGTIFMTKLAAWPDSGRCKGYGWIEFESLSSAESAMRGWTEVRQTRKGKARGDDEGIKKVWLTRMGDRKLRMEYAEDPTTRYNKRFGKNAKLDRSDDIEEENGVQDVKQEGESQHAKHYSESRPREHSERKPRHHERKVKDRKESDSRYDQGTVQKLTGAIVKGQGSKVTFD